jgi:hypothetical protein
MCDHERFLPKASAVLPKASGCRTQKPLVFAKASRFDRRRQIICIPSRATGELAVRSTTMRGTSGQGMATKSHQKARRHFELLTIPVCATCAHLLNRRAQRAQSYYSGQTLRPLRPPVKCFVAAAGRAGLSRAFLWLKSYCLPWSQRSTTSTARNIRGEPATPLTDCLLYCSSITEEPRSCLGG